MKISKIVFAVALVSTVALTSCRDTKSKPESTEEHGHEHDADGGHMHEETIEQEEFHVDKDSMEIKPETHKHDDGSEHHNH
ncbi:hypothetical protein DHD05_10660 [Arenibacter sp. N53]|jgi:hypothetical protein|uniref:Secreted protein n=1 Tax=Arenibacter echinorum TaxID=440515 RepID=A0A327R271_9FLAO|nr:MULTISPECIES: hypothetical protein [Arenibacter]MCK0191750.1 hypothetical protein [Arenibacter sp. F20364]MCM4152054.1 hypothetical protein [Arenibacter sp. N53]RAJ10355.1 hypothetical protein LV92_03104 [Arenibacter echinorum]GBF22156.1 hypothetical protein C21_04349 [Arenibacter sp. NBRC 103722]|tara:strand:- start:655 stop:897 length:243 start_codon:yes stop_codon:yes gene_type:complete